MSLCKLVVMDYFNYRQEGIFELRSFLNGWDRRDILNWIAFVEYDLEKGIGKNWWWRFHNKNFLKFLRKYLVKLSKGATQ